MTWRPIETSLPPIYEYVLVCALRGCNDEPSAISIARWCNPDWDMLSHESQSNAVACGDLTWYMSEDEITHWMPLPPEPEIE